MLRSAWRRPTSERKEDPKADGSLPLRPSSSDKTFKIWVGTFNMGAAAPPKDPAVLRLWMQPEQRTPDAPPSIADEATRHSAHAYRALNA